ncbi:MAG: YCF48-related protein [Ignavibacteria bacterium]
MKKTITISLLLLMILLKDLHSQSDWFWLDPLPTGATLKAVDFADQNTGYTCGKTGVITKTTNGGLNWMLMNPVTVYELMSIECLDQNTCIVVGDRGSIFKTTDGAQSWVNIPSGLEVSLLDVDFPNSQIGFITGASGVLLKTTNGGENWNFISLGISSTLFSVSFNDVLNGVAGGANRIYTTTNGGLNWSFHSFGGAFDYFQSVDYVNDTTIYGLFIDFPYKVYKSTNRGASWDAFDIDILNISELPRAISFNNSLTGHIATKDGNILTTSNGGSNWVLDTGFAMGYDASQVFWNVNAIDSSSTYAVGSGGIVVRSTNAGESWQKHAGNLQTYYDIYFTDIYIGYIIGEKGLVRKTTDGGLSWNDINLNTTLQLNKIFFTSSNTGYICGDSGLVRKTTDAGLNWISQTTPAADTGFMSIHFINDDTGFLGTDGGSVLKTTNSGSSWRHVFRITGIGDRSTNDFDFLNETHGVVAATLSLYFTTNSGDNWTSTIFPATYFNSINYLDSNNIIAFASSDKIVKSTNAGQSWFNINNQFGGNIYSSQFFGNQFGIICGEDGRVARTTNGGINWILQEFLASEFLNSVYFANPNIGYIVGEYGQIIKTTNGGLSFINLSSQFIPENYTLHQNYPNPFNPNTTIDFELRKPGVIRISVYDISGKFVKTLVDKFHTSGIYSLKMEASELSSGVYFYTMYSSNHFINSKKFLKIK